MDLVPGVAVKVENVTEIDPLFFEIKKEINEEEAFMTDEASLSVLSTLQSIGTSEILPLIAGKNSDYDDVKPEVSALSYTNSSRYSLHRKQCSVCGKSVKELRRHMLTHARVKDYKCYLCGSEFTVAASLTVHIRSHTGELPFSCEQCGKKCATRSHLNAHKQCHAVGTPCECYVCHKKFKHYESVRRHMRKHNQTSQLNCNGIDFSETSDRQWSSENQLISAECSTILSPAQLKNDGSRRRRVAYRRPCNICGKFVVDMYKHKLVHQRRSQEYQTCEICGKSVADVQRHMQMHQGKQLDLMQTHQVRALGKARSGYKSCEICGKLVADVWKHRKTHTKQARIFKTCDICGKAVVDLYKHQKIHSRLVPSKSQTCDICGKFVIDIYKHRLVVHCGKVQLRRLCTICGLSVVNLPRHRRMHEGIRSLPRLMCNICGKVVADIRTHQRRHEKVREDRTSALQTKKNHICADCGRCYSTKVGLSVHMWNHSAEPRYRCTVCGKAFHWHSTWKRHLYLHGIGVNRMHSCPICTKAFASPYMLRDHMRMHSGEKPYMCSQCGNCFVYKSSLNFHQKSYHSKKKSSCQECGKAIAVMRMAEHMRRMHHGVVHNCPHCELAFRQQSWLDWHILSHATTKQLFSCDDCLDKDIALLNQPTDFPQDTDVSSRSVPQLMSDARNLCLPQSSDSYVQDTNVAASPVMEARPDNYMVKLKMLSSENEASQLVIGDSAAVRNGVSSQVVAEEAVGDNKSLTAEPGKDLSSRTADEVELGDDTGWKMTANEVHECKDQDRCISCNKLRPLQQCPVCHSMYPSVALHVGVHSIRKTHTRSDLDSCPI